MSNEAALNVWRRVWALVVAVVLFVVWDAVFPHAVKDFEPALGEAAECGVVGFAFGAFALVEVACPASGFGGGVEGELDQRLSGASVGGVSSLDTSLFAALNGERCDAPCGGELAVAGGLVAVLPESGEEGGGGVVALDGQGSEDLDVGVLVELLLDAFLDLGDRFGEGFDLTQDLLDVEAEADQPWLGGWAWAERVVCGGSARRFRGGGGVAG